MITNDLPSDVSKKTGTFKSFDGTPIYYEVRGEGEPVFLCYGIACPINHWSQQIKYFSRGYQTIVFDYRGHHRTPAPEDRENLSLDAICRDMKELADHLGIKKASYWGHSYGVQILLRFYDMYPDKVSNLVFINGFSSNPIKGMFGGVLGANAISSFFNVFREGYKNFPETLSALWKTTVSHPLAVPLSSLAGGFNLSLTSMRDIEIYARGVSSMDLDVFITLFDQMMKYDGSSVLDRIEVPVLIISGSKDGVTPVAHQIRMHQRIRGSQFLRVPYGSHCTQLDLPDFVNLRIEKFLDEIGYGTSAPTTGSTPGGQSDRVALSKKPLKKKKKASGH
jgi:pimeloyl-ACP methyl ester carboxylesterase